MLDLRRLTIDLVALGLLAGIVFLGLALATYDPADPPSTQVFPVSETVHNLGGTVGALTADRLRTLFGLGAWFLLAWLIATDVRLFTRHSAGGRYAPFVGGALSLAAVCVALAWWLPGLGNGPVVGSGGYLGASGAALLEQHFAPAGVACLLAAAFVSGLVLADQLIAFRTLGRLLVAPLRILYSIAFGVGDGVKAIARSRKTDVDTAADEIYEMENRRAERDADDDDADDEAPDETESADVPVRQPIKVNPPAGSMTERDRMLASIEAGSRLYDHADVELPDVDILEDAEDFPYEALAEKAQVAAEILERTFKEFNLNVRVVEIDTGPVITQFELELEAGLRLNKVTALADDLAIALRVPSVRVVPSIPGKNTVGVEVPNDKQVMVRLRELIESDPKEASKKRIPIYVGKDVSGHPLVVDLTKMPHLLIAGRTGTGKSVCLNTLILSMLMTRSPDEVKMLMIDPKMVELSPYKRVPHLMHPVITDMKKAEAVLAWAVEKMEERYDLLARCGVRHLDGYNKLGKEEVLHRLDIDPDDPEQMLEAEKVPEKMPYIVILADEMADMMMTSGKDVEGHIIRLAQKSRAVGIHLVLATQKPTVDVITGLIKSNLPARISFQVASRTDSRVVLDEMGAEKLLGNGDMLYLAPGTSNITRAQGTYVSDEEIERVIDFYGDHEPQYNTELAQLSTSGSAAKTGPDADRHQDDLYDEAIDVVVREGRGSVSLLQRCLGIGYGRAARLIDYMAEDGIVGDYNGSQAREVLYSPEQWEAIKAGEELEDAAV